MEMALRAQSPLCPRCRPELVVRPAAGGGGGGLAQSTMRSSRSTGYAVVRCSIPSSGHPRRKPWRMVSLKIKGTTPRAYAPRLAVESSTKNREQSKNDEEAIGTYNGVSSSNVTEWTSTREVDTSEIDLVGNASSSATLGEGDAMDYAGVEKERFDEDLLGHGFSSGTQGAVDAVDRVGIEEENDQKKFSESSLSSVDDEVINGKLDHYQGKTGALVRLKPGPISLVRVREQDQSIASVQEQDQIANFHEQDRSIVGFDEQDQSAVGYRKQDRPIVGFPEQNQSTVSFNKQDRSIVGGHEQGRPIVGLPEQNRSIVGFNKQDRSIVGVSEQNRSIVGVFEQDHSIVGFHKQDRLIVGASEQNRSIVGVPEQDQSIVGFNKQDRSIVGVSEQNRSIVDVPEQDHSIVGFDKQDQSIVGVNEQNRSIVGFTEQDHSIVGFSKQDQSIVGVSEQNRSVVGVPDLDHSIVGSKKQNRSIAGVSEQNRSIVGVPEQNQSIVGFNKQDRSMVGVSEQNQSIVGVPEQDHSIVGFSKQDRSIVGACEQSRAIVDVLEQKQPIVGFNKQDRSIVGVHEQNQSIVGVPEQNRSIVGFNTQDRSIVGIPGEGQIKQVTIIGGRDVSQVNGMEAKDGDDTSQKIDQGVLHEKFDADSMLQKLKRDITKEAVEKTSSNKLDEEYLAGAKDQVGLNAEEQHMVAEEEISVAGVEVGISEDEVQPVHAKVEHSAEDEVEIIEDEEQYEVDKTCIAAEQDVQESLQDEVDPQVVRRRLEALADESFSMGIKLFVFPEVVKSDSVIDLYLNRSLSALANEPDVLIKGGFNGWRWKPFTEKLQKSDLRGDWWCCKLYIPKQAYRLDFVFFNGRSLYENNNYDDFVLQIESIMDEDSFEDFFVEENQRELERLAAEEAKRKRQAEEQFQREEERATNEADRAQAKAEVEMKKNKLRNVSSLARTNADNLWYIEPNTDKGGDTIRLYYNRSSRPLVRSTETWMHGGYNNWIDGLSIAERLAKSDKKDGDWWYADVILPKRAYVLDWVFADGPPGNARNYDNNGRQDFHGILPNSLTDEHYWVEEEERIYTRLKQERIEREYAIRRKAERTAKMKAEMKEKTMRMFLLSQKHIVYTEPLEVHAGATVDVLYNPSNTVLNGKPEVWFRCSFNRWTHPSGVLLPQKMVKTEDSSHVKATVRVPLDAYMMDFVFSESEEGGIYDNKNGMDYHIPVSGSVVKEPPMNIVHIAVEMAPIAKVGGLGDVVTSLSRAVQDLGHNVKVILPKYDCLNLSNVKDLHFQQSFTWSGTEVKVWFGLVEGLPVYFLDPENGMFRVGCVYGRNDDSRFGFFCRSALEYLFQSGSSPHIIHCHDWSSAPVAWLYKEHYADSGLPNARVIFTIHNLEFGAHYIGKAMAYCDKATTVSYTYSREVAGHGAIAPHHGKFYGILNGIDPDIWDPYNDNFIPVHYTSENVVDGKRAAKKALQQKLGLQQTDVPIVGIITRLTVQKGINLIKHGILRTLERNGQVVLLGSAPDHRIQSDFCNLANTLHGEHHGRVKLCLTYDEPLSHLIYAGADFILVPSLFEPCGLTQLVAMRYGSIPVVRRTGGLYDTVFDIDHEKDRARAKGLEPNGFSFEGADSNGVDYALNRAISAWFDARNWFYSLCKGAMEQDWSWNRPALDYIELYHSARKF